MYGARSLDLARSRYTITLNSKNAEWSGSNNLYDGKSWNLKWTRPGIYQLDPKYKSCLVALKQLIIPNPWGADDIVDMKNFTISTGQCFTPFVDVHLRSHQLPNSTQETRVKRVQTAGARGDKETGQTTLLCTALLENSVSAFVEDDTDHNDVVAAVAYRAHEPVRDGGKFCPGTIVNDDIEISVRVPHWKVGRTDTADSWGDTAWQINKYTPGGSRASATAPPVDMIFELEVQLLCNEHEEEWGGK